MLHSPFLRLRDPLPQGRDLCVEGMHPVGAVGDTSELFTQHVDLGRLLLQLGRLDLRPSGQALHLLDELTRQPGRLQALTKRFVPSNSP